jgi:hypothetical protein
MISKENVISSCIKTTPIPWPKASHSTINAFLNFSVARPGVVPIASLSFSESLVASFV